MVETGELITIAVRTTSGGAVLVGTEVFAQSDDAGNFTLFAVAANRQLDADEGVTWIRGWHDRDSEEGRALLATWALTSEAVVGAVGPRGATGCSGVTGATGMLSSV